MRPDSQTSATLVLTPSLIGFRKARLAAPVKCQYSESPTTKSRMFSRPGSWITVVCRTLVRTRMIRSGLSPTRITDAAASVASCWLAALGAAAASGVSCALIGIAASISTAARMMSFMVLPPLVC